MRVRAALVTSLALVTAAGALAPAVAAKKSKPISKTYEASAPLMSPSNTATSVCEAAVPMSAHDTVFKAPFTGRLSAKLTGFQGDWDFAFQDGGTNSAESAQEVTDAIDRPEEITGFKMKKGASITIRACNFSGGPTATVSYTFAPV